MKHLNFLTKTRWLLVPLMLLALGVGQMWGAHTLIKAGDMVSGEKYIITAEYNSTRYYFIPNQYSEGAASSAGSYTTSLTDAAAWTFTKSSTSWVISTKVGNTTYYLGNNDKNNGVKSTTTSQTWAIAESSSGANTVKITGNNSRDLALYQSSNWRCYSTNNGVKTITLYRVDAASCSNKVNISAGTPETGGSFSLDKTGQQNCCSALTVTVSDIVAPSGKRFKAITQSGIAAAKVSIDQDAKTVTYAANSSGDSEINVTYEDKGCTDHGASSIAGGALSDADNGPVHAYYDYSTSQFLYTKSDLDLAAGKKGTIKSIYFEYSGATAMAARTIKIYMANTDLSSLTTSNYVPYASFTQVYSGTFSCGSAGWYEITLDTPFDYNGAGQLAVMIDDNTNKYESYKSFKYHSATGKQIYKRQDDSDIDPASWTPAYAIDYRPNTKFCIEEADMTQYTVNWYVNNSETPAHTQTGYAGVALTDIPAPTKSNCDGNKEFVGWYTDEYEHATNAPAFVSPATIPDGGANYYAVFANTSVGDPVETILWSEDFNVASGTAPIAPTGITYTCTNGGSDTKIYDDSNCPKGGTCKNLLIGKSTGSFLVEGIPTQGAQSLTLSFSKGGSGTLTVSSPTSNVSVSGSTSGSTITIGQNNVSTFDLLFSNSSSNNLRIVDIAVSAEVAPVTYSNYATTCCSPLAPINGSVNVINPASAEISWNNIDNVSSWTVNYKVHSAQGWTNHFTEKTGDDDDEITIYSDGGTNNKMKTTITTACNTLYDFQIIANPASNYCDKDETLDKNGSGYNSGKYSITRSGNPAGTVTGGTFTTKIGNDAVTEACNGSTINIAATPANGYQFSSWSINNGAISPTASAATTTFSMPSANVTVDATFSIVDYTITYNNMDGATNHANNPATYKITDSDITLGTPTKDGWTFEGWFNNSDLAEEHKVTGVAIAAGSHENKTFYAKWVQKVTLSKASASHGSFVLSSSYTGSPEISSVNTSSAAKVYVVCTPDDGYEVSSVSQSGIAAGNVTISGSGNARTIEYAQGSNGASEVSVAFSCVQPSISVQPASANYAQNAVATALTVTASAAGATLGYQWQTSSDNENWTDISEANGGKAATYTPSTATANTTYYRVEVTNNATGCSVSQTSDIATIIVSASVCATPQLSVATGTYNTNQSVTISCATEGATIRYTTNGDEPTESSPVYSGAISVEVSQTIKAKAFKSEWTASNTASATYTLQCATPEFDKGTNTYLGQQDITLSCATTGASIYYTLDGSTPSSTNGTEYTGAAITVSTNQTIKMIAVKDGWSDSEIDYATYTIQYTVTWNDNSGQVHSQAVTYGSDVYSCPSDPGVGGPNCGDKFMGWTTNPTYKGNSAPPVLFTNTSGEKPAIIGNTNFYAVFADFAE